MKTIKIIPGLVMAFILSFSAGADELIDDDLIVNGISDGTALAYDCSATTLPFILPFPTVDPGASNGFVPAGDPILVPVPLEPLASNCDFSSFPPAICAFTCIPAGSASCIGFDCADGEAFDSDEFKLKETNTRIRLHDTSIADVLGQSWNVEANEKWDFGPSYFAFQVKSLEIDAVALSDGTAPAYDCLDLGETPYAQFSPPSSGIIPLGEPRIRPTPIFPSCVAGFCLHTCEEIPDFTVKSVLKLGTGTGNPSFNDGVAIGYESSVEDGVVSVGRADLKRRIAHVAAGIGATDALTREGLQIDRIASLALQIADANAQLDAIDGLIFPLELLKALSQEPPVLPSGEVIDTAPNGDMTAPLELTNLQRLQVFRDTLARAISIVDADHEGDCAQLAVNIGRLNDTPAWFVEGTVVTEQLREDMDRVLAIYGCP